jgi:internalin A
MERFDLSYRVTGLLPKGKSDETSLIAQLVPDNRPEKDLEREWPPDVVTGDIQQVQICRIVDDRGQSAPAEGLFYQLIVRLHRYSLGRVHYNASIHWQRGLILDDDYNGRALLEHVGNDVRISVRAPYPERFLAMLTGEVKYLVESFWEGLRCEVMVPCVNPCGRKAPGTGLFEVQKLIDSKRKSRPEYPCPVCNEWQNIDYLLRNAPAARPMTVESLFTEFADVKRGLVIIYQKMQQQHVSALGRFDQLDASDQRLLSRVDDAYARFMQALTDEAKEGPRLFSLVPVDRKFFNPRQWTSAKFRLTLWCEHSRLPLPAINGKDSKEGVYEIELTRAWFKKAAPFLKVLTGTLSLVLPIASSGIKLALDDTAYKAIEEQLDFGKDVIDASLDAGEKVGGWLGGGASTDLEHGEAIRAQGAVLREFHALLKSQDPTSKFGGLVRVLNKRQEFLWVHSQYAGEY